MPWLVVLYAASAYAQCCGWPWLTNPVLLQVGLHDLSVIMWAFARLQYSEAQIPQTVALFDSVLVFVDERYGFLGGVADTFSFVVLALSATVALRDGSRE